MYSIDNAIQYKWSSVTGLLDLERVAHLDNYLVGTQILDAGCGGGAYIDYLNGKGYDTIGLDNHNIFLDLARTKSTHGKFVQADIMHLPFKDKYFDCTYCFDVLEHVADDRAVLQQLVRVTKKRLIIAVPKEDEIMHQFNLTFLHYIDKTHLRQYTEKTIMDLVSGIDGITANLIPELPVNLTGLLKEVMIFDRHRINKTELNSMYIKELLKNPRLLSKSKRDNWYKENHKRINANIWSNFSLKTIYTGLIAIMDLELEKP